MPKSDDPDYEMPAGLKFLPLEKPAPKPAPKATPPDRPKAMKKPKEKPVPKKAKAKSKPKKETKLVVVTVEQIKSLSDAGIDVVEVAQSIQADEISEAVGKELAAVLTSEKLTASAAKFAKMEESGVVLEVSKPTGKPVEPRAKKKRRLLIADVTEEAPELEEVAVLGFKDGKRQVLSWVKLPKGQVDAFKSRGSREDDPLLKAPTS